MSLLEKSRGELRILVKVLVGGCGFAPPRVLQTDAHPKLKHPGPAQLSGMLKFRVGIIFEPKMADSA